MTGSRRFLLQQMLNSAVDGLAGDAAMSAVEVGDDLAPLDDFLRLGSAATEQLRHLLGRETAKEFFRNGVSGEHADHRFGSVVVMRRLRARQIRR